MSINNNNSVGSFSSGKRKIGKVEWSQSLEEIKISKEDMNNLIMNYLVIEGYKDAAEKFQQESGTNPQLDLNVISDRMAIRTAIQCGNIEEGISRVNHLNPEILQNNEQLSFHLQQQRLIEFIRQGQIAEAIAFAQQELAPKGEQNQEFLTELERTMALLAFDDASKSPVGDLLDVSHRQETASELNSAILTYLNQEKEPKLPNLLKMLKWSQSQLEEKVKFPKITNFSTAEFDD